MTIGKPRQRAERSARQSRWESPLRGKKRKQANATGQHVYREAEESRRASEGNGSVSRRPRNRQTAVRWQTSIPDKAKKGRPDNSKVAKSQPKTIIATHFTENIAEKSSRTREYNLSNDITNAGEAKP